METLGNINDNDNLETKPDVEEENITVNGTSTSITKGVITSLGDVLDNGYQGSTIQQIGDVIPDDPNTPNVGNIGNVYPKPDATTIQGYIDDVIPDDPNTPNVERIGNIYPVMKEPTTQGYIDDVIPDETIRKPINKLNNVYPKTPKEPIGNVEELGNINVKEKTSKILEKLDKLSEKKTTNKIVKDLGGLK